MKLVWRMISSKRYLYDLVLTRFQVPETPPRTKRRPISIATSIPAIPRSKTIGSDADVMPATQSSSPSLSVIGELKKRHGLGEDLKKNLRKVAPPPPPPTSTIPGSHAGGVVYPTTQHSTFTKSHQRRFVFDACFFDQLRDCPCSRYNRVWI